MQMFVGKINGIDAQAFPGMPKRCQAYVVNNVREIQVSAYTEYLWLKLQIAALVNCTVTLNYTIIDGENQVTDVRLDNPDLLMFARAIAKVKDAEVEESAGRIRVLDHTATHDPGGNHTASGIHNEG